MITKGIWIAEKPKDSNGFYTVYTEDDSIQLSIATIWDGGTGNAEDNARLIAASKDLLEACKGMIAHLGPNGYIPGCGEPKTRAVREAIAKATN